MDGSSKAPNYNECRFLIADDKAFIRTIVYGMLVRLHAKDVIHAANGEQATKLLRKYGKRINCVISDWNMHPVGGLELLRAVRTGAIPGVSPATCFIMLTGHAAEKVVRAAIALDVNAYLVKPISFEKLVKTVETAMARPLVPKTSKEYLAVDGLEIPAAIKATEAHLPPWVVWMAKSPRRKELDERIKQIRQDAAAARDGGHDEEDGVEIKNTRRELLDQVTPGLVLAEDIYADDRALLVAAGTVITRTLLARLKDLSEGAEEEVRLWVGDAVKVTA